MKKKKTKKDIKQILMTSIKIYMNPLIVNKL